MSDGLVITEEKCAAKGGWNLAELSRPLFLLGGHRFPFVPLPVGEDVESFNISDAISFH